MSYMRDSTSRRLDGFEVAGERAAFLYDPAGKADGALPSTLFADTGQAMTAFPSPSAGAQLAQSGGVLLNTTSTSGQSAGYLQGNLGRRVRRLGCMASWPAAALGVVALVIPSAAWSTGVLPNAGFHLSINGNGVWTLIRFTTGGQTTLASYTTHGRPKGIQGAGMVPIDIKLDPENAKAVIQWWDGSKSVISSSYFTSETSNYAIWELFANVGNTDVGANFGALWASGAPTTGDARLTTVRDLGSSAVASYNVAAAFTVDFSKSAIQEATLAGNLTSLTLSNAPNQHEIFQLELVQDATGGRTLSGSAATIKWAGGAAPTLSTTAGRRDIFRFRYNGQYWLEVSRSMNL